MRTDFEQDAGMNLFAFACTSAGNESKRGNSKTATLMNCLVVCGESK